MTKYGLSMLLALPLLASCDGAEATGSGRVRILLSAEDSITSGLDQGSEVENTRDYAVRFDKFLATVGGVTLRRSRGGLSAALARTFVVDMTRVGADGVELGVIDDLRAGEWDKFGFETPTAGPDSERFDGVSEEDFDTMVSEGLTYWIEGRVLRSLAQGGPVSFSIRTAVPTRFRDCEYDGEPGLTVLADGTATASITLHGDHMFFNAFPTGSEGSLQRLSGYLIAADKDADGHVDSAELSALDATEAFPRARGYSLDAAPSLIDNALDFVRAQLATQGHYQGEGECIFELSAED